MTSESHNARLGGINQDIQDFKIDFNSFLSSLKNEIQSKFENINIRLNQIESNFENNITVERKYFECKRLCYYSFKR